MSLKILQIQHVGILYACVQQNQQFSFQGRIQGLKLEGTQVLGRGSGGRVESPSRSRAKPWWGSRGQNHRKHLGSRDFVG